MHIMTPRGESPSYLSKIYLPYLFLSFSWPATHHNNFHSFGSILNRHYFLWHNISVVSSSMCHALNFVLRKIKYWDYFSHFLIEAMKLILSENQNRYQGLHGLNTNSNWVLLLSKQNTFIASTKHEFFPSHYSHYLFQAIVSNSDHHRI